MQNNYYTDNIISENVLKILDFLEKNYLVKQYLIRGKNYVIIKLYTQLKDVYQIDFIIPLSKYESELESIESSIGTITYKGKL